LAVCLGIVGLTALARPVALLRHRWRSMDRLTWRLRSLARLGLALSVAAIVAAFWLVIVGWPMVALSAPAVTPIAVGIYAAAWTAAALTPVGVWHAARFARRGLGGRLAIARETTIAAALVLLTAFTLLWHIAGTTLAF
jgi:hypothetical protein